jgi:RNA polymerase sigma-70 factor (ECF subfamily)
LIPVEICVVSEPPSASNGARSNPSSTSRSLLHGVRQGDASAWDRLVSLYAPLVYHRCRRHDLQDQDAADVFQEVFLAVARHIEGFRKQHKHETFRGWLHTITCNKINDLYRRRGKEPIGAGGTEAHARLGQVPAPMPQDDSVSSKSASPAELSDRWLFHRALERIRESFEARTWQAFWRTAIDGRSAADVAAELKMTPGAVRVAKSRVLQRLREELGDVEE